MNVELLYIDGCSNYRTALKYVGEVLREKELSVLIKRIEIKNDDEARKHKFIGSPTIRINDRDVDPGTPEKEPFSMRCRLYLENNEVMELPSKKMIRRAIEKSDK